MVLVGVLDFLKGIFGHKKSEGTFKISTEFSPLRIDAGGQSSVLLKIDLYNNTGKTHHITVECRLPQGLAFDTSGIVLTKEYEVGALPDKTKKRVVFSIHSLRHTQPGRYPIIIEVFFHEPDKKDSVLFSKQRKVFLRAV